MAEFKKWAGNKGLVLVCLVFFFFNSWDAHRAMNLCILGFFSVAFTGDH